ncbi:autotransporter outer membrane beta-barrel domain-containing protein [Pseudomonas sp. Marseille-Q1929]|uniref:autotransporter outer membrane beta-barrel domain-containing protein n=1 Tax=Pseudomonas sp. Marseille-Q1929 TaxID=2730402 RepID=UPI001A8D8CBD|nr:autotransporter outer membrane beta-barrel domain-containing protein [Pseudomonas sp. Marseille-Q1929]MBO0492259.1 autotransporter outer membrane beta-barrel domain-containing protein [Pseudomonas sp. Marseille-Q1929]
MPITPRRIAFFISLAVAASLPHAQARGEIEGAPIDGYFTRKATSYNGLQVAKVLEPAAIRLLESGQLTSEQLKALEKFNAELAQQPNGFGAALKQLAGSQNANLAAATQSTTQQLSSRVLAALRELPSDTDGHFWVKNLGNEGGLEGQLGTARLNTSNQGVLMGADWAVDHAWRVGVLGAKSSSRFDTQRFTADLDSWHLGGYAVRQDGPLALRLGAIYSSHTGQNRRGIEILSYKDTLKGSYNATGQNVFGEAGYQLGTGSLSIEPFAGLGYQRYSRDRFREQGGPAALNIDAQTQQNLSSTFGLRLAKQIRFDNQMSLTPHLSAGWKHLYGDVESSVRQSFRHGGVDDFTIQGTSLDRNSLSLQAGLDLALSSNHTVGLAYLGENGTHSSNQGLMGQWRMRF